MDMFDEARAIKSTMELCHVTQSELAKQLGVSQSYVANKLRLLNFSEKIMRKIRKSGISERHARSILRLGDEDAISRAIDAVTDRSMTVRECEAMVDSEVLRQMPERVGRRGALEGIEDLKVALLGACEHLRSLGVEAKTRTSYLGNDMYITVIIKDA